MMKGKKRALVVCSAAILAILLIFKDFFGVNFKTVISPAMKLDFKPHFESRKALACSIQHHNAFHPSIMKFYQEMHPVQCKWNQELVTFIDDNGILKFKYEGLWNLIQKKRIKCQYAEVVRLYTGKEDTFQTKIFKPFKSPVKVTHTDFVKVICRNKINVLTYRNFHVNIRDVKPKTRVAKSDDANRKYNVLLFGIDSVSRLNAIRQLPKSYSYMENYLDGFIMKGYHKAGSNTFMNLAILLTGSHPFHKPPAYYPLHHEKKPHDPWPFIWKNFSSNGYRTMFAEDDPMYNAFHFERAGFKNQPTDHYSRSFWKAIEADTQRDSKYCYAGQVKHQIHFDYVRRFVNKLHGKEPFWGLSFISGISHGYLNTVGVADDDILNLFKYFDKNGYFDDTFLFFFSDHGQRFDDIRKTYIGGIEDKMPFFSMYVPDRFRRNHADAIKNLQTNQMRLTSPFDVFCTLAEILKLSVSPTYKVGKFKTKLGRSLFGEIPQQRTCWTSGIDGEFCTCQPEVSIDTNISSVRQGSKLLLDKINSMLSSKFGQNGPCAVLRLKSIKQARMRNSNGESPASVILRIETSPSNGLFEGQILISEKDSWVKVTDNVERINRYGNQSSCIHETTLKPFCYCQ